MSTGGNGNPAEPPPTNDPVAAAFAAVLDSGSVLPAVPPSEGSAQRHDVSIEPAGEQELRAKPMCQYPGCQADISKLKRYNVRCKICDEHRLAKSVILDGVENRFCQQCNRFHTLDNFDEGKKGCKEKLEKHNKRRRYNRRTKAGMAEEMAVTGLTLGTSSLAPIHTGGFMEDMARAAKQMRLPDDATKSVFSKMANAAAATAATSEAGKETTVGGEGTTALQLPPGFPNNMPLPPGMPPLPSSMQLPPGLPPASLGVDAAALQADPNNRQSFQNYVLLAAYAAYMSGGFQQ